MSSSDGGITWRSMATCTPIYQSAPKFTVLRGYFQGVRVMDASAFNAFSTSNVYQYQWGAYTLILTMRPDVWSWSSNRYTVDYVWDYSVCRAVLAGVDQNFALYVWVTYSPVFGGLEFRVKVQPSVGAGILLSTPLAPSSYWYNGSI